MLRVVCVQKGDYCGRGAEYVNILFDSVRRNLSDGFEGVFECFTDTPEGLHPGITIRELPANVIGWWNKLYLFADGVFPKGDQILFFDLDTLITGRLDEIAQYDGNFAILRDFYRPDGLQSAVMSWKAGLWGDIWDHWVRCGMLQLPGGDQAWIERMKPECDLLQDKFPDLFVSFKQIAGIPNKASVVCFHGLPRPHDVMDGWVPQVWKIGGLSHSELDAVCNTEIAKLNDNIRHAISLPREWLELLSPHNGQAVIVGGGPSLLSKLDELKWRHSIGQTIFATNGSAKFLHDHGITPHFHVLLDARPENVSFVDERPSVHLVASQCDKAIFEKLEGRSVVVFHHIYPGIEQLIGDDPRPVNLVGGGSTVGLKAMAIAYIMGYRKFHLYGMDSCYEEDKHHAYSQPLNDRDQALDVLVGDRHFKAAPWMVIQANEFQELAAYLANEGCVITVAGDGMLAHVAREMMANPTVTPADIRAMEVLRRLDIENPVGAEIGVFAGDMSSALLARDDLALIMVDSWEGGGASYDGDSGDWHAGLSQSRQDAYFERAKNVVAFAGDRATIIRKRSVDAAKDITDHSLDFVFIDADHSYEGCKADIAAWESKIKPGGLLAGHDYENTDFPKFGVTQAVNEYVTATGKHLDLGDNFTWFVRL